MPTLTYAPLYSAECLTGYWIVRENGPQSHIVCISESETYARAIAHALNVTRALAVETSHHPNWN